MHSVVEYIDRHLDRPLDLAALADVAHFSPFHFHRLFSAWMGERLGDYLRRRRVEVAAVRLSAQPRVAILDVALAVGFGSGEAFSRAFKDRFGAAPSVWRRAQAARGDANRKRDQVLSNAGQVVRASAPEHGGSNTTEAPMIVEVIQRAPKKVAYLRRAGPYGDGVAEFWQNEVYPWMVSHGFMNRARYGISLDDPSITAPELCRYDACAELPPDFVATRDVLTTTIPGGRYAVLRFKGRADQVADDWDRLLRDWLPGSGLQLDARPMFEHYPEDATFDPETGVFDCEICIPVAPL